jgi:hypothetical protein
MSICLQPTGICRPGCHRAYLQRSLPPAAGVPGYVSAIADRNLINPVATWITSKTWDGIDRLPDVYGTLVVREDFTEALKETLMNRWHKSKLKLLRTVGKGVITARRAFP